MSSFISKLFHKSKTPSHGEDASTEPLQSPRPLPNPAIKVEPPPYATPLSGPATANATSTAQAVAPGSQPPTMPGSGSQQRSQMQNIGMVAGFVAGDAMGGNPTMGMVDGMVAANFIGQRIQQAQRHEYMRNAEARYQAGDQSALAAPVAGGRTTGWGREGREERRRKRWDRRAARKGIDTTNVGGGRGLGLDEDGGSSRGSSRGSSVIDEGRIEKSVQI